MDYSIDMTSTFDDNNDKKITFEDIAHRWSKRLALLTVVKGSFYEKESIFSDILTTRHVLLEKLTDLVPHTVFMDPLTIA
jgi:hypothetical protein